MEGPCCDDEITRRVIRVNGNRVSTKSQIGASSVSSGRCVKSKMLLFLRKNAYLVKNAVNPNKNGAKK